MGIRNLINSACFILLLGVASCSPVLYSTTVQNTPLFKSKGEASVNASYAESDDGAGVGLMAATAVTDHFALITSYYHLSQKANDTWKGKGSYFEFGGGYYSPIADTRFVYEVFVGAGWANIHNENNGETVDVKYFKPFIQPSIGITHKIYEIAFTPRIGVSSYTSHSITLTDPDQQVAAEKFFDDRKTTFVFEPGVTLRCGYKNIKGQLAVNLSSFTYATDDNQEANINNTFITMGVNFLISKRYAETAK